MGEDRSLTIRLLGHSIIMHAGVIEEKEARELGKNQSVMLEAVVLEVSRFISVAHIHVDVIRLEY